MATTALEISEMCPIPTYRFVVTVGDGVQRSLRAESNGSDH